MVEADFTYGGGSANRAGAKTLSVSVFADRAHIRDTIRDDALAAGFALSFVGTMADLLEGNARSFGEVILVDCPVVSGAALASLARLDMQAAGAKAQLVVSTSVAALDDVFACLDQSRPQILVAPSRAERVVALGRVLALVPENSVRELSQEDRLAMLRLTEQVGQIAERLDSLAASGVAGEDRAFRLESPSKSFHGEMAEPGTRLMRAPRPPLPDPRLVRQIIRQRQARARFFDGELFADPAWDILLDLTAARAEHLRVSVTSLCIAAGVPPTTALRWIAQMTDVGLLERVQDETDRRRAFIALADKAADGMARYFAELGKDAARLA